MEGYLPWSFASALWNILIGLEGQMPGAFRNVTRKNLLVIMALLNNRSFSLNVSASTTTFTVQGIVHPAAAPLKSLIVRLFFYAALLMM